MSNEEQEEAALRGRQIETHTNILHEKLVAMVENGIKEPRTYMNTIKSYFIEHQIPTYISLPVACGIIATICGKLGEEN